MKKPQTLQWLKSCLKVWTNGSHASIQRQELLTMMCTHTLQVEVSKHVEKHITFTRSNFTIMKMRWKQKRNKNKSKNFMAIKKKGPQGKGRQIFYIWVTMMELCSKMQQKVEMSIMINLSSRTVNSLSLLENCTQISKV